MRAFLLIVLAGLGCALLGCGFGWLVGILSPEFIALIVQPYSVEVPDRLGAAIGLVSGLLLGTAAMMFGLLVEAFRAWVLRLKAGQEATAGPKEYGQAGDGSSDLSVRQVRDLD